MKYDRPVWQIMHACADAMPDIFGYENVREWFAEHYPEGGEATIRAHLIGLTQGFWVALWVLLKFRFTE